MSADNWADCPRCKKQAELKFNTKVKRLADSYGNMSEDDYLGLRDEVAKGLNVPKETLSEYYELGIYKDKFGVSYKAECRTQGCGFGHTFKHDEELESL